MADPFPSKQQIDAWEELGHLKRRQITCFLAELRRTPRLVASTPKNEQLIADGKAVASIPRRVASTPDNEQLIDAGQAIARIPRRVAHTPANQLLIDAGQAVASIPQLVAHKPANQLLIDAGQAIVILPKVNRQQAAARAAKVPLVPDTRTTSEQEAAAAAMVGSLVEQMKSAIGPGIKWYAGIGAKERVDGAGCAQRASPGRPSWRSTPWPQSSQPDA